MLLFHHFVQAILAETLKALAYIFQTADLIQIRHRLILKGTVRKFHRYHAQCPVQCPDSQCGRGRSKLTC